MMKRKLLAGATLATLAAGGVWWLTAEEKTYAHLFLRGGPFQETENVTGDALTIRPDSAGNVDAFEFVGPMVVKKDGAMRIVECVPPEPQPSPTATPVPNPTPFPCPTPPAPGSCECGTELDPTVPSQCGPTERCISSCPTPTPAPTPTPTPTPSPSPSATPTPPQGNWGTDWQGKPLPAPPVPSCKSLPDDPPGLLREPGPGCDVTGGSGTGLIKVTNANSSGPGSLLAALFSISQTARRIEIDPAVAAAGKSIVLQSAYVLKERNVTLNCNGATIEQRPFQQSLTTINRDALGFGATDDIIVTLCRFVGTFKGVTIQPALNLSGQPVVIQAKDWVPPQNNGNGFIDGDVNSLPCDASDSECNAMDPALRRSVVGAIFDRNTWDSIGDDALGIWGGGRYIQFTRNFVWRNFHPSTTGWKGLPLPNPALMRLWNLWAYNVASMNGERNLIYPREGTHGWIFRRNFVADWKWYETKSYVTLKPEWNSPQGVRISGQAPNESNMGWGEANCALGTKQGMPAGGHGSAFDPAKANSHASWGFAFDNGGCDSAQACAPACDKWSGSQAATGPSDPKTVKFGLCHPRAAQAHYWFAGNEGEAYEWFGPWPKGFVPPSLPYTNDLTRPWSRVLDEVGAQPRTSEEQAEIDRLKARAAAECKALVPPK